MTPLLATLCALGALGAFFGVALAVGGRLFPSSVDPRLEEVNELLPGVNCGACGFSGCLACAAALLEGDAEVGVCPVCTPGDRRSLSVALGRNSQDDVPPVARIFCRGGYGAVRRYLYEGLSDCRAANQIGGGVTACDFGCLRYYSCLKACPFGAISIDAKGNPVVDEEKCRSCGICVQTCPRGLITLVPASASVDIRCASRYTARDVIKVCSVGCIGCGKCVKACPVGAIVIEENLARIDYNACISCGKCIEACPRGIIEKGSLL